MEKDETAKVLSKFDIKDNLFKIEGIFKTKCIQQFKNIQWLFCLDDNDERMTSNNIYCE